MSNKYSVLVYLDGCGELIVHDVTVDDSDPEIATLTVQVIKPGV